MVFACMMFALGSPVPDAGIALPGSGETVLSWLYRLLKPLPIIGPLTEVVGMESPSPQQQPAQAKPQQQPAQAKPQQQPRPAPRPQQPAAPQQQPPQQRPAAQQPRPAAQQPMPQQQRPAAQQPMPQQQRPAPQAPQQAPQQQRPAGLNGFGAFGGGGFPGFH
ncbi:hypothetical protein GGI03_004004 [Coemansia sp. RSA 2337]|nr:hypothetical protein GGI03_004004 [Coemansia sp. RSA 2337]